MPEFNEQTSASDRYAAARRALADYDAIDGWNGTHAVMIANADALALALRALITPPGTSETVEQIVDRVLYEWRHTHDHAIDLEEAMVRAANAGIQSAHEAWEPEVALRPTQEQMLRWLGISYDDGLINEGELFIYEQRIEKEED